MNRHFIEHMRPLRWGLAVPSAGLCLFGVVYVTANLVYYGVLRNGGEA